MAASDTPKVEAEPPVRWARVLGVLVAVLLVLEVIAQLFVYVWVGRPFDSFAKFRLSPYGLVRNNPELTLPGFSHNKNGFRNTRDFEKKKPPNTLRVLILGGSTAYSGLASEMIRDAERPDSNSVVNRYLEDALRRDPELAGLEIEVPNAAIPFNRGFELGTAYIAEYAAWDADIVVVMGTSNNFVGPPPKRSEIFPLRYGMTGTHPWAADFDRVANSRAPLSVAEHWMLSAEEHSATFALLRKGGSKLTDVATAQSQQRRLWRPPPVEDPVATLEEFDLYVNEVVGVYDAMLAVARRHDQEMVFFWEYFLRHLRGVRDYSDAELELLERLQRPTDARDRDYNFRARDSVAQLCKERGAPFLDPLPVLEKDRTSIFIDYLHYTPDGNRVMAEFMARELRDIARDRAQRIRRR